MNSEQNRKRLERQARSLILTKDISIEDRDKINSLMRNQSIAHEERYTTIINILKRSPDKETSEIEDEEEPFNDIKTPVRIKRDVPSSIVKKQALSGYAAVQAGAKKFPDINGPTETKLYINEIFIKFKKYKLFKKKYLVRRDNRIGYGWSRRLIPSKKFIALMNDIRFFQESILSRLPQILEQILKDESIETPLEFNYLRQLRRWMIISPFTSLPYEKIKWMQQWDFERELRAYVINFHSFIRIDSEQRELVLALIEKFLREEPDLKKEEIGENEERSVSIRKENENYRKEKAIFEYLGALRSFMAIHGESDSFVAAFLRKKYDISTLEELLNMTLEALVFQRPFTPLELREYFEIRTLTVSAEAWDLSSARLKIYGKDPESKRIKQAEKLQRELLWYDTIHQIVRVDDNGQNILVKSVEEQWKYVDRVNRDSEDSLKNNFIVFLEGLTHYFRNLMIPVLNGRPLMFDYFGEPAEGAIFSHDFFSEELREIESLISDIYHFRNINPTLKVTDDEIKKIVAGKISSMNHVEGIVFKAGSSFYALGKKLHEVYHNHMKALEKNKKMQLRTTPIEPGDSDAEVLIPYSACLFKGFEPSTPLLRRISGRKILSDSMKGGIIIFIMAFCYQAAALCGYPQIQNDLGRRDLIKREIKDLTGGSNDTKK
jgi:hypothetical protein